MSGEPPRPTDGLHFRWECPVFRENWRSCTAYCNRCTCYVCNLTFHTCRCSMAHRWACPAHMMAAWELDRREPPFAGAMHDVDLSGYLKVASVAWDVIPQLVPSNFGVSATHLSAYLARPVTSQVWVHLVQCLNDSVMTSSQRTAASLLASTSVVRLHAREMVAKMYRSDGYDRDVMVTFERVDPGLHQVSMSIWIALGQNRGSVALLQLFGLAEAQGTLQRFPPPPRPTSPNLDPRLMSHQHEACSQMRDIEHHGLTARLWQRMRVGSTALWVAPGTGAYVTDAEHPPACALHGGMLCNDRGTGKTRVVASLIASHRAPDKWPGSAATLVVVPAPSLLGQWLEELELYNLHVNVHFGKTRLGPAERDTCDVVLTTASLLRGERTGLFGHDAVWWRVVYDEGHRTLSSGWRPNKCGETFADAASTARNRWLISGTPDWSHGRTVGYINLLFGRVDRGDRWHESSPVGLPAAQWMVASTAIGVRTGTPTCMPTVRFVDHAIDPPEPWAQQYRAFECRVRELLPHAAGRGPQLLLTRLLQATAGAGPAGIPGMAALNRAQPAVELPCDVVDCAICLDRLKSAVETPCKHYFCRECVTTWLRNRPQCPLCRTPIGSTRVLAPCVQPDSATESGGPVLPRLQYKVERLLGLVLAAAAKTTQAVLCFSRYPAVRKELLEHLQRHGIDATDQLAHFSARPTKVLLLSPQACGVGLNLTQAATVVLCEPSGRRSHEVQAVGRAARMGQLAAEVVVHRPYISGTVEERLRRRPDTEAQDLSIRAVLGLV